MGIEDMAMGLVGVKMEFIVRSGDMASKCRIG